MAPPRGLLALIMQQHAPKLVIVDMTYADAQRSNAYAFAPYYGRSPVVDALLVEGDWRERVKLVIALASLLWLSRTSGRPLLCDASAI